MMTYSAGTAQGPRSAQEDRFFAGALPGGVLLAVFDGHGGDAVSEFAARNIEKMFLAAKRRVGNSRAVGFVLAKLAAMTCREHSGSTASIVWVSSRDRRIYIGILGDSPIGVKMLRRKWIHLGHNVATNVSEREAAIQRGAAYVSGYITVDGVSGLQFSRSLGDVAFDSVLDRSPELFSLPLRSPTAILVATDGICDNECDTTRLLRMVSRGASGVDLVGDAIGRGTGDNATALVCFSK